ncbi:MAG: acetolactate synthase small subunit [Candidatus Caldatribacteriota bacterium]|jgi:acetolactate synthase-1/3 small subunit|nr:acetolactate synthase small subunit [Atribacterota bacterium]MDD3031565.1 acetolactate synthase small subunit [Atribacterota bacterium]MDD3641821.1 acetolactate synthase small subunit [Atribacterota bacterium]MDD4288584.1 acetolactate synthase small subunit [Atribacterota bacterium]MDD4765286.1 acetolactate synthase small subunit [Atribacterota bacterium]
MKHTIAILVEDQPGVMVRVASLFTRRGFNIESIAVGHSEKPGISRMTIITSGDEKVLEQITKQLNKLIDIIRVRDISPQNVIERELVLVKVHTDSLSVRAEIIQLVEIFKAKVVYVERNTLTIEMSGDEEKINGLLELLKPFGIIEIVRTGRIAIARSKKNGYL